MSSLPTRAKDKHFKTIWDHTFDNSPTDPTSSFLKLWTSKQEVETLYNCSVLFIRQHTIYFNALFVHDLPYRRTTRQFLREVSPTKAIFQLLQQRFVIRTFLYSSITVSFAFAFTLSASQIYVVKKIDKLCTCLVLLAACSRLWCFWATHGLPSLRRWCTVGIDWDPPAGNHIKSDGTAERHPFVVGAILKSCGRRDVLSCRFCNLLKLRILTPLLDGLRWNVRVIDCLPSLS